MSFCPGYLSITINDLQDAEELFRYDALIFCPTSFNMSFKVPNRGQKPDRTFEMRLEDAKKSYRQVQILISDASGGGARDGRLLGPNSIIFMQCSAKIL